MLHFTYCCYMLFKGDSMLEGKMSQNTTSALKNVK